MIRAAPGGPPWPGQQSRLILAHLEQSHRSGSCYIRSGRVCDPRTAAGLFSCARSRLFPCTVSCSAGCRSANFYTCRSCWWGSDRVEVVLARFWRGAKLARVDGRWPRALFYPRFHFAGVLFYPRVEAAWPILRPSSSTGRNRPERARPIRATIRTTEAGGKLLMRRLYELRPRLVDRACGGPGFWRVGGLRSGRWPASDGSRHIRTGVFHDRRGSRSARASGDEEHDQEPTPVSVSADAGELAGGSPRRDGVGRGVDAADGRGRRDGGWALSRAPANEPQPEQHDRRDRRIIFPGASVSAGGRYRMRSLPTRTTRAESCRRRAPAGHRAKADENGRSRGRSAGVDREITSTNGGSAVDHNATCRRRPAELESNDRVGARVRPRSWGCARREFVRRTIWLEA